MGIEEKENKMRVKKRRVKERRDEEKRRKHAIYLVNDPYPPSCLNIAIATAFDHMMCCVLCQLSCS